MDALNQAWKQTSLMMESVANGPVEGGDAATLALNPIEAEARKANGVHVEGSGPSETAAEARPAEAAPSEEETLWKTVRANAGDFGAWTSLIQATEKKDNIEKIRGVYDAFLLEFPLCYGYWKKYADHEMRHTGANSCCEVYERAVVAVAYSVDIWVHYCTFTANKLDDIDRARRLYERAASFIGEDYLSHLLWDKYLDFELTKQEWHNAAAIYAKILQIPLQQLDRYYTNFKEFVNSHPIADLRSPEENQAAPYAAEPEGTAVEEDGSTEAPSTDAVVKTANSEADQLAAYLSLHEGYYKASKEREGKIKGFELAIKRPYFHVKALDDQQLANWHKYLDFMEKEGDRTKTVLLYERCVIPCALYPEYWIRYVESMDSHGNLGRAKDVLQRATTIFVKRRPEIHLFAALYCEEIGDLEGSGAAFERLDSEVAPGLLESTVRRASYEHRQGNDSAACDIFKAAIETMVEKQEKDSVKLSLYTYLQYARFLDLVLDRTDEAREVYHQALGKFPGSKNLWQAAIAFEASLKWAQRFEHIQKLVEEALVAKTDANLALPASEREELCLQLVEYAQLFGSIQDVKRSHNRLKELFPARQQRGAAAPPPDSRKRPASDAREGERPSRFSKPAASGGPFAHSAPAAAPAAPAPGGYANGPPPPQYGGYGQQGYGPPDPAWQQPMPQGPPAAAPSPYAGYPPPQHQGGYNYGAYPGYAQPPGPVPPPAYSQPAYPPPQAYAAPPPAQPGPPPAQPGYYPPAY